MNAQLFKITINDEEIKMILGKNFNDVQESIDSTKHDFIKIELIGDVKMKASKEEGVVEYWLEHKTHSPLFGNSSDMANELYSSLPEVIWDEPTSEQ